MATIILHRTQLFEGIWKRTTYGTFLWNFVKILSKVSEVKFFEGKFYWRTHARTDDGRNAMTIARWPLASGAKIYSSIFRNWEIRSHVSSRRHYIVWHNFLTVLTLIMSTCFWKYLEWMISTNLVDAFHTFWGILGHRSVPDFSEIYAIHIHFYVIGHPGLYGLLVWCSGEKRRNVIVFPLRSHFSMHL